VSADLLPSGFWKVAPLLGGGTTLLIVIVAAALRYASNREAVKRKAIEAGGPEAVKIVEAELSHASDLAKDATDERKFEVIKEILDQRRQRLSQLFFFALTALILFVVLAMVLIGIRPGDPPTGTSGGSSSSGLPECDAASMTMTVHDGTSTDVSVTITPKIANCVPSIKELSVVVNGKQKVELQIPPAPNAPNGYEIPVPKAELPTQGGSLKAVLVGHGFAPAIESEYLQFGRKHPTTWDCADPTYYLFAKDPGYIWVQRSVDLDDEPGAPQTTVDRVPCQGLRGYEADPDTPEARQLCDRVRDNDIHTALPTGHDNVTSWQRSEIEHYFEASHTWRLTCVYWGRRDP